MFRCYAFKMNGTNMTEKAMIERKLLVPGFPNTQGSTEVSSSVAAFVIFLFADFVLSNFCDIVKFDLTSVLKKFPIVVCFFSGFVTEKNLVHDIISDKIQI